MKTRLLTLVAAVLLAACGPSSQSGKQDPIPSPTPTVTPRPTATPTFTPTDTPTPNPTATPSPTPDPNAGLTIADLAARSYGGGEFRIEEALAVTNAFTRSLVACPSDGLTVYSFMNVPRGQGPFPVVLVLHGYVNPTRYQTLAYNTRYADALAEAGYLVIHPNFRNYPPSEEGPNPFRVGYAVAEISPFPFFRYNVISDKSYP